MVTFDQITVTCGLLGAVVGWFQARGKSKDEQLGQMSRSLLAGATVPTGLLLLASSYDQRLLTDIKDIGIYLLAGAIAVLYLAYAEFVKP